MNYTNFIIPVLGVILVLLGGGFFGWFRIVKETNNLLREQNAELKIANKDLELKHQESLTQLSSMQGQIDILKSIPLVNIDTTLKQLATANRSLAESNKQILETLQNSANLLAKNTAKTSEAVSHVKDDLENRGGIDYINTKAKVSKG